MRVSKEFDLVSFEAWSGAVDTKETIINEGKTRDFEHLIEELYPDGIEETQLNDLLWFDDEWIFKSLGINTEEEE